MSKILDLAVIGSGPAALTAAIYAARSELKVTVFERKNYGGSLPEIAYIANFPGFTGKGQDLANTLREQAETAGATFEYGECTEISPASDGVEKGASLFALTIDGERVLARSIIIATGSEPRTIDLDTDKPISYCALCDAPLYKDKKILVIGGGNSAVSEAILLSGFASKIILANRSELRAEKALVSKLKSQPNVTIHTRVEDFTKYLDQVDGIFVFIGKRPASKLLSDSANNFAGVDEVIDQQEYIITDTSCMTKIPGIFAAGDVRQGTIKQAITASADGAAAAIAAKSYLDAKA